MWKRVKNQHQGWAILLIVMFLILSGIIALKLNILPEMRKYEKKANFVLAIDGYYILDEKGNPHKLA